MSAAAPVALEGVVRRYGRLVAVDGLSFALQGGEMFGMIGPDGAGKSTTLRMVLGLLAPDAGRLRTLGLDPVRRRREVVARTGYLSQRFSLYGDLSVDENIAFFAAVRGVRGWRQRRDELLELVGLAPFRERLADRLSGGMRQKLALACTLIHTPELLVLDEPTTGVDPVSRRELWRVLAGLQREGLAILVTTPYLDEAERCQRVALIDRGRLLALDTPEALRGGTGAWMLELIARPRRTAQQLLSARGDVAELASFGERLHVTLTRPPSPELVAELGSELSRAGVAVEALRPITPSLEDVFIARIRTAAGAEEPA